ncbi:MAG: Gfo/Idh/MocA family oxidoreductase [Acidobacteria bacterium]|nr:Gfo/Idh/MocA family oxidoreductase [Acidobacteriota bacterium]
MSVPRIAVVGCGAFGRNHLRVVRDSDRAQLVAAVDRDAAKAETGAAEFGGVALTEIAALRGKADAAIVAVPTTLHAEVGCALMEAGLDVLIEKPIASTVAEAGRLVATAAAHGRILQVGQLERFNPAVMALTQAVRVPLFFEVHRLSVFAPRSLDVDVVLDLMIHDLDIVLSLVGEEPNEVRAAGIRILSEKVDIANVRLAFPGGCVANLTASRVSTEKVRKLRLFQPHEYISIDYARQDGMVTAVSEKRQVSFRPLAAVKREPLAAQLDDFLDAVAGRTAPRVDGVAATRALAVASDILVKIEEHARIVNARLQASEQR